MVFSDGVDSLVDGYFVFRPETHSGADPCKVVAALLQENIEPYIGEILGHPVEPRWNGPNGNRAIAVLGNLLGGTDVRRLEMTMDQERLADDDDDSILFHINDTSIILCDILQVHNARRCYDSWPGTWNFVYRIHMYSAEESEERSNLFHV